MDETSHHGSYFSDEAATFGDRVAAARRHLGLTQEALARKLGIKLKTLRAWEDDFADPRANKLQMLAGVLNVSIMWLLTGEGDGLDGAEEMHGPADPDLRALLADLRSLTADQARLSARFARLEKSLRTYLQDDLRDPADD